MNFRGGHHIFRCERLTSEVQEIRWFLYIPPVCQLLPLTHRAPQKLDPLNDGLDYLTDLLVLNSLIHLGRLVDGDHLFDKCEFSSL